MEEMSIGKRIMTLRKQKGLTQEQLAERVSVSPQAVSKWENDVSCPDIAIIPKLAEVLGVTTDELLGVKPFESRPAAAQYESGDQRQEQGTTVTCRGNISGGVFFALAVILVGVVLLLGRLNVLPFSGVWLWGIVWPALLLGLGVSWLIDRRSPLGLGVALLGLYYLLFNLGATTFELSWNMVWPALLILFGLTLLFDRIWPHRGWRHNRYACNAKEGRRNGYSEEGGYIKSDCSFCEDKRIFAQATFTGGDIDVSFGHGVLDLTRVQDMAAGAVLSVDVSFAACEVFLPRTVRIEITADKSFGSIQVTGTAADGAPMLLRVNGDVSFGALEIKYV